MILLYSISSIFVLLCLYITKGLPVSFPPFIILLLNNFIYLVFCSAIFRGRSLESFWFENATAIALLAVTLLLTYMKKDGLWKSVFVTA